MRTAREQKKPQQAVSALHEDTAWHERVAAGEHILQIDDLTISTVEEGQPIVSGVSFSIAAGEILGLVGESGSGKTTVGLALLGHIRKGLEHTAGTVTLYASHSKKPAEMLTLDRDARRRLRGTRISYIPQDPALSLNPGIRVGKQIREVLDIHQYGDSEAGRRERVRSVLREVGLPDDDAYQRRWPHQLSGGQQQRIGIAMAFAMYPDVIVLDEPTTGLDVTTPEQVLETIRGMTVTNNVAGLYITHDLAVVSEIADRVAVMLKGELVEWGETSRVLYHPEHEYTRRLVAAVPDLPGKNHLDGNGGSRMVLSESAVPSPGPNGGSAEQVEGLAELGGGSVQLGGGSAEPVEESGAARDGLAVTRVTRERADQNGSVALTVCDLSVSFGKHAVLSGVNLEIGAGTCTMLLGQSGSGKTTLARSIAGILSEYSGTVEYRGQALARSTRHRSSKQRQQIQYIFQSPYSSLNPRRTIGQSLSVPLEMTGELNSAGRRDRVLDALDSVRLGREFYGRRPGDLSGGERQRAAIARALVNMPSVLVCDEITSALDVSVQASIISLLRRLQEERGLSMLFVTHNIALARHIASRVAILSHGQIVEHGLVNEVLDHPQDSYTQELLANVPTL